MTLENRQNLEFLKIQHEALTILGLDLGRRRRLVKQPGRMLFCFVVTTYMQYGFINFVAHSVDDIDRTTSGLSMFNQGLLLTVKVVMLVIRGDGFLKLIWEMNALAETTNEAEQEKWLSENYFGLLTTKCYYYACVVCVVLTFTAPVIFAAYEHFKGIEMHLRMPFEMLLPSPFENGSGAFSIFVYVMTYLHIRALRNSSVGIDTMFGWFIFAISGHFHVLRVKIDTMARKLDNNYHDDFSKDIANFVSYHHMTLKFLKDLNLIYGEILFAEISFSCLQICFHLYTMTNVQTTETWLFHLMAFLAITIQVMIYCFGGEKIQNENDLLCDDIYMKMPWEKMKASEMRQMLLPLIRSQQEASLYGMFFLLNRNLLVYIFKTAFSCITLLGTIKE